jgi:hypothetical protein
MSAQNSGTLLHAGVLGIAVAASVGVWVRDKDPKALAQGDVVVWSGRSGDVEKVGYESKTRHVELEAKKDAVGRYFVGTVVKEPAAPVTRDGGAPPPHEHEHDTVKSTIGFVSVGSGDKLAEALAPLKALRSIGKVGDDRAAEFGLAEPEATVTVRVGGVEHKLVIGGVTPGGGDRYARLGASGEVFVVKGEPLRNLESPDSMLLERELHEWKDTEVVRARVEAGGKGRDVTRGGPEGKRFWSDAQSPDSNDETLGNWMSKLDRLRPTEYLTAGPETKEAILRVEYTGKKPLGFVEVVKVPGGEKPAYYLRTERTRLFGKVTASLAEQLEQDLGTIVK